MEGLDLKVNIEESVVVDGKRRFYLPWLADIVGQITVNPRYDCNIKLKIDGEYLCSCKAPANTATTLPIDLDFMSIGGLPVFVQVHSEDPNVKVTAACRVIRDNEERARICRLTRLLPYKGYVIDDDVDWDVPEKAMSVEDARKRIDEYITEICKKKN